MRGIINYYYQYVMELVKGWQKIGQFCESNYLLLQSISVGVGKMIAENRPNSVMGIIYYYYLYLLWSGGWAKYLEVSPMK